MDLGLSEEQQLLKDSAARLAADHGGVEPRRRLRGTALGFDPALWRTLAELGWLGLPLPSAHEGLDGNAIDVMVLMEQMGRALLPTPYLVDVVICGGLLAAGSSAQQALHLPPLVRGEAHWALAYAEDAPRFDPGAPRTTARGEAGAWVLDGAKIAVLNGHAADRFIVSARTGEAAGAISLFLVEANAPGLERQAVALVDGSRGAQLRLGAVRVDSSALLGPQHGGLQLLEDTLTRASVAMGAEALGAMDALLEQTVAYTKTRVQFGQPIASFQALQHRMTDMYLHCQALRSLVYDAAIALAAGEPRAARAAAAVKVKMGEAGRFVAHQAVQLHGGIGMTDELAVSHYFKRLMLLNALFGDAEYHLDRYVALA